jgi:AraC-like DNA-binding protein
MTDKSAKRKTINPEYSKVPPAKVLDAKYFYFETEPESSQALEIIFGGYEKCATDFELKRNTYPWYVLEYSIKGSCKLIINQTTHFIEPGTIAAFCPGDRHHYICDKKNPMEHYFVIFTGKKAEHILQKTNLKKNKSLKLNNNQKAFETIRALINTGLNHHPFARQICACYLNIFLLEQASGQPIQKENSSIAYQTFTKCTEHIDKNFTDITGPSEAAQACGINVRYMSRLFKKYHHLTPQEYITRLKLNKAAGRLLSSAMPINQIAKQSGFSSPHTFRKTHLG